MAMQAEQLFSNHLPHRHPGTFYTNSAPWKEIALVKKVNTFTTNLLATLCYMYGNGAWDYSVPKTCPTIKEMENTNKNSFKQTMELVNHFVGLYNNLDNDNAYALRYTVNDILETSVIAFLESQAQNVKRGIIGPAFLLDKCLTTSDLDYDSELEGEYDDEDESSRQESGWKKHWLQGVYLPNAQILISISSGCRRNIDVDNGKGKLFLTDNELALLSNTPALYPIQGGISLSDTPSSTTPKKRSNEEFKQLVVRKTKTRLSY
jgi:hypothetical protein